MELQLGQLAVLQTVCFDEGFPKYVFSSLLWLPVSPEAWGRSCLSVQGHYYSNQLADRLVMQVIHCMMQVIHYLAHMDRFVHVLSPLTQLEETPSHLLIYLVYLAHLQEHFLNEMMGT